MLEKVDRYCQLMHELDLKLVKAVDTHLHADHITGLGALRDRTQCVTVMGEQTKADVVSMRLADGDKLDIEGVSLDVIYTPGHTDDSYSYLMGDRVFTGDTLLIRGTGRTDFQNGDARAQYEFDLQPAAEAARRNAWCIPRTTTRAIRSAPSARRGATIRGFRCVGGRICGPDEQSETAKSEDDGCGGSGQHAYRPASGRYRASRGWAVTPREAIARLGLPDILLVDLRGSPEREDTAQFPARCMRPIPILPTA